MPSPRATRSIPLIAILSTSAACLNEGSTETISTRSLAVTSEALGARPVLGWNSFDVLSTNQPGYGGSWLTESHIRQASDVMHQKLQSAGYEYINVDSGWSNQVDQNGIPMPDPSRFPSGIASLANYVHTNGQKLGIYHIVGVPGGVYNGNYPIQGTSCHTQDIARQPLAWVPNGWYASFEIDWSKPCSQAYVNSLANRFASWGVDLVKVDGTTADNGPEIQAWQAAIAQSGRPMWFTVSAWPVPLSLGDEIRHAGQSVRVDTDIDCYCSTISSWTASVNQRWTDFPKWLPYVGPGHFPDFDSMPISNNTGQAVQDGLNDIERQSVMSFWSMASAPLWVGGDIWFMDAVAQSILTNPEVIAVDQAAVMPQQIAAGDQQQWKKAMPDGSTALGVFNLGNGPATVNVDFASLGISGDAAVRDLAVRADLGVFTGGFIAANIPAHGSRLLKVTAQNDGIAGYTFCASEYRYCTTSGTVDVAYGAQGFYVYKNGMTGIIDCDNGTFGSDPAYGSTKGCYVRATGGGGPSGFTLCAGEGQTCSPSGAVDIAYGAVGQFQYKTNVVGSVGCNNGTFGDPAYGWTKACYTRPSGGGVAYEAEAATISGNARVADCSSCSGSQKVGYLGAGSGNRVTFSQVDVGWTGSHLLFVHAASADPRSFAISVNGGAPVSLSVQSRDWWTPTAVSISIPLNRGINTIAFSNDREYAPDLDRIVVW